MDGPERQERRPAVRWAPLLRFPLAAKLIVADSALVIAALLAGVWLAGRAQAGEGAVVGVAVVAVAATIAINAVIVYLALRPLHLLERAAAEVAAGKEDARAELSAFADRRMARVILTFNAALDAAHASRRRVRAFAARSLNSAEAERRRIAVELHEGVAQMLAATRLRLRLARGARDPEVQAAELEQLSAEVGKAIEALRTIAVELRPLVLDVLGLGPALEALVESIAPAAGLRTDVQYDTDSIQLGEDAELALYRILEEALANVVQHAGARTISVHLHAIGSDSVQLVIEDDGRGFAADERITAVDAIGLAGMQERASYVGGRLEILSAPGRGTRVVAEVPMTGAKALDGASALTA